MKTKRTSLFQRIVYGILGPKQLTYHQLFARIFLDIGGFVFSHVLSRWVLNVRRLSYAGFRSPMFELPYPDNKLLNYLSTNHATYDIYLQYITLVLITLAIFLFLKMIVDIRIFCNSLPAFAKISISSQDSSVGYGFYDEPTSPTLEPAEPAEEVEDAEPTENPTNRCQAEFPPKETVAEEKVAPTVPEPTGEETLELPKI